MNFSSYFVLSTLIVVGIVSHAYVAHEQFYPAVVYLSTDKMCLAVMYNFAFAMFLLFGKALLRLFIGTLRDLEVEQLVDSGRGFLADTILFLVFYAPTIDNKEVGTVYLIQYICCVIFMKVFHLTTQIRVSHMFEIGVPRLIVNIKLVTLMGLLLSCDLLALQYFYGVASRSSTFFTWILFEALTMSTVVMVSICKYAVHMVDLRLDNGWPGKSVCLFYIDLVHDVASMTLFLVFMLTFFVQNPSRLPIYMMADVIQVARKLAQRLRSFRRYRRISLNMEMRFPDASDEEIEQHEHCVICRDSLFEASKPKKLPCGHMFHIDCLRSWLVMQQVCPTCRAEIPAEGPILPPQQPAPGSAGTEAPPVAASSNSDGAGGSAPAAPSVSASTAANTLPAASLPSSAPASAPTESPPVVPRSAAPSAAAPCCIGAAGAAAAAAAAAAAPAEAAPATVAPAAASTAAAASPAATSATSAATPAAATATASATTPVSVFKVEIGDTQVQDIMASLKRAEEISTFLRQQTDFWMEQVRQIEQAHSHQPVTSGTAAIDPSSFLSSVAGIPLVAGASAAGTAVAASSSTTVAAIQPSSEPEAGISSTTTGGNNGSAKDPMAELRRVQKEQWERKRTSSNVGLEST